MILQNSDLQRIGRGLDVLCSGGGGRGRRRRPRPLLDDGLPFGGDYLLGTSVQLGVLDEAVAVREPGAALLTAVGLLALEEQPTGKKDDRQSRNSSRTYFSVKNFALPRD